MAINKITSNESSISFEWNENGKVITVPKGDIYTTTNEETINFVLTDIPHNIGISVLSSKIDSLSVDGIIYDDMDVLQDALEDILNIPVGIKFEIVDVLPEVGENGKMYLVPITGETTEDNSFDEYVWLESEQKFEKIGNSGSVDIDLSKFLDKTNTGVNTLNGKIQIGDSTHLEITNAILHVRKVSSPVTDKEVNGACFSVNGDGTATLQHKTYNSDALDGAKNSAVLRMSNKGLQFAVNTGSTASPAEKDYKNVLVEGDAYAKVDTVYIGNSNVSVGTQQYNVGILNSAIVFSQNGENIFLTQPQVKWVNDNNNKIIPTFKYDSETQTLNITTD